MADPYSLLINNQSMFLAAEALYVGSMGVFFYISWIVFTSAMAFIVTKNMTSAVYTMIILSGLFMATEKLNIYGQEKILLFLVFSLAMVIFEFIRNLDR